jgi:hypothetical protein
VPWGLRSVASGVGSTGAGLGSWPHLQLKALAATLLPPPDLGNQGVKGGMGGQGGHRRRVTRRATDLTYGAFRSGSVFWMATVRVSDAGS